MASATATASSETGKAAPPLRLRWPGSRIGRTIIALNVLSLVVLVAGALVLNETRRGLVETQTESLRTEGQFIANIMADVASIGEPEPQLIPDEARLTLFGLNPESRVRLFDASGQLVADSAILSEQIEREQLPDLRRPRIVFGARGTASGDARAAEAAIEAERKAAMQGGVVTGVRPNQSGDKVVSVSIPIRRVEAVLGVLTLEGDDIDAIIARQRAALIPFILIAALVTLASSLLLNFVIARPVLRLARAADQVRLSRAREISLPDISRREDELGDLSTSLETMTRVLSERMDAIERFAADVAHEIRNPLTSVRSAVETLELVSDEGQRAKLMGILKQDVARLDRLITDISNSSRLDAELSRDEPRAVELDALIADIVALYDGGRKGAPVLFERPKKPMTVTGREGPLGQVVRNLIDNARSFTRISGHKDGAVRVTIRREGRDVLVQVDDDGPGIPPENLETVFERFYTSRPKDARVVGGAGNSGLGLSIARQISLAHNGRLWAENRTDENGDVIGARFILALPSRRS